VLKPRDASSSFVAPPVPPRDDEEDLLQLGRSHSNVDTGWSPVLRNSRGPSPVAALLSPVIPCRGHADELADTPEDDLLQQDDEDDDTDENNALETKSMIHNKPKKKNNKIQYKSKSVRELEVNKKPKKKLLLISKSKRVMRKKNNLNKAESSSPILKRKQSRSRRGNRSAENFDEISPYSRVRNPLTSTSNTAATVEQVCAWLCEIGMPQYQEMFLSWNIDGKKIWSLDSSALQVMGMSSSVYTSKFLGTMELIEKQYGKGAPVNLSMLRNANVKREVKENIDEEDGEEDELVLCKETGTLFKADAKILNEILDLPQTVEFEKQQQENKEILKEEKIDEKTGE